MTISNARGRTIVIVCHLGAIQIAKADMFHWRNVEREEKKRKEQDKLSSGVRFNGRLGLIKPKYHLLRVNGD